jgi:ribosomal protein S18 acetylase RimI-like enzyme
LAGKEAAKVASAAPLHICAMSIRPPHTPAEWAAYYALRYEVLRRPWNQPAGTERVPEDDGPGALHAAAFDAAGNVQAVGCLHPNGPTQGQVRFMAVASEAQGQGLGGQVLDFLEEQARAAGLKEIVLHSRENAVRFYERHGYAMVAPSHTLFGTIPHFLMRKTL